jgi:branched-chain amino acid transport system ATP-binding protein
MSEATVLRATALTRRFGGLVAVDRVSLDLRLGEVHALIGPNGAGKTTLTNLLAGQLAPSTGSIFLDGRDVTGRPPHAMARLGVARSFQRSNVFAPLTAFENCRLAAQALAPRPWRILRRAEACSATNERAQRALQLVGLAARAGTPAAELSHGEQRQLETALCLAGEPRVLLLDEPLAGMGPDESDGMLALIGRLRADHAILMIEHDMDAVFALAERITVMANGAAIASGAPEAIRADARVQVAYLGEPHG